MASPDTVLLAGVDEAGWGEVADRLQQPEAVVADNHERAVHETAEDVEHLEAIDGAAGPDLLGGVEREAPGEHRQRAQQRLLGLREQVVAPLDGRAQGLLAGRARRRAAGEE